MSTAIRQLATLGAALEYPTAGWRQRAAQLEVQLSGHPAALSLRAFLAALEPHEDGTVAEIYTRTFDLAPQCAPFLGEHLFGAQAARRSRLMVGLASEYAAVSHEAGSELPDHVAVVLQALPSIPDQTREALLRLCVRPSLLSMAKQLRQCTSPYEHLLHAALALIDTAISDASECREVAHA